MHCILDLDRLGVSFLCMHWTSRDVKRGFPSRILALLSQMVSQVDGFWACTAVCCLDVFSAEQPCVTTMLTVIC